MRCLPTIRFEDPVNGEILELSLETPYKLNVHLIIEYGFAQNGNSNYMYLKDEYGHICHLPSNYVSIIEDALELHENTFGCSRLAGFDDIALRSSKIIGKIKEQCDRCTVVGHIQYLNSILRNQVRYEDTDYMSGHECILYDNVVNISMTYRYGSIVEYRPFSFMSHRIRRPSPAERQAYRHEAFYPVRQSITISADEIAAASLGFYPENNRARDMYCIDELPPVENSGEYIRTNDPRMSFVFQKNYIHPYNYVPEYIKHFMPGESENTTLLLGAEIEVGGNDSVHCDNDNEHTVKKCIQIINESDSDKEDLIYSTHDGTVQIEFDTMPCSLEFHKNKMNYRKMFEYLDKEGYKGHDCETAGLHIHANRSYLGKSRISQELVISKILYILEKFNDEICVIARRDNDYSQFAGEGSKEDSLVELYGKYKDKGKRAALNLQHKDTIEFRMFKSTLKYETFILTLEFVRDIIDYAKSVDVEEIELVKWSDLMDCFSPELREYYEFRYKKKVKDANSLTIKQIRKRISKLKSELKNSKNFFQKTKLQQEISDLEKEYKKSIKKAKKVAQAKRKLQNFYDYI